MNRSQDCIPTSISSAIVACFLFFAAWFVLCAELRAQDPPPEPPAETTDKAAGDEKKEEKKDEKPKWDVTAPLWETERIAFEVDEGTWMSLDVSPDGREVAFDLLGDIYVMPIEGGAARAITSGPAYDVQPRYSPDGQRLSFTSDRGGADNIWVMERDGSKPVAVTDEDFRLLNNAVWTGDGRFLVMRKHFTSERSLGAGEMWIYPVEGGSKGLQLTTKKNDQQDAGEPCVSRDGRFLYWSEDMSPGGHFEYNKDPNGVIYVIQRLDRETGEITTVAGGPGGSVRPTLSPDGNTLAFVRRVRGDSRLFLRDLKTGVETPLAADLSVDGQETWSVFGVYPNFAWTPDGQSIVYWALGKIWRVAIADSSVTPIPFKAEIAQDVHRALRFAPEIGGERFPVRVVRWPSLAPDDHFVVFQALGFIWVRDIEDIESPPTCLTHEDRLEYAPSLSRDGSLITCVTWDDVEGGAVWAYAMDASFRTRLTPLPGHYTEPSFSPDGEWVVYRRGDGDTYRGNAFVGEPGIYVVRADGSGEPRLVTRDGRQPRFWSDGSRIDLIAREGEETVLASVNLLGGERRVHAKMKYDGEILPSPDRRFLAFTQLFHVYVTPFPATGRPVTVSPEMDGMPVRKLSVDGGEFLTWSADSKELRFGLGPQFFRSAVEAAIAAPKDKVPEATQVRIGFDTASAIPSGIAAFIGARALTMRGDEIIEDSVVVVEGNRITAVGKRGEVVIPDRAQRFEIAGKTLLPGYVDIHAHTFHSNLSMSPRRKWAFLSELSFGTTTTHDPSNDTKMIFAESELMQAGRMTAPRIFSTGTILYGAEGGFKAVINSKDDALHHVRRLQSYGAFSVKSYNQPRRNQRQQVLAAAHELGMMVVPEGGSMLHHNLSMILDGHTTIEHALPVAPLYNDVLTLFSRSKTAYTPTLVVAYGGAFGETYWYQKTDVWQNARLLGFVPRSVVDPRARRRTLIPDEEFHHLDSARMAAEIEHRGGNVQIGAHGQMPGVDVHWELWMLGQGGLTNHEALQAATLNGARALGLDGSIGSIEEGKLADLIVLDEDPLADLTHSTSVSLVMVNGRLHDALTLDEIYPEKRPLSPPPHLDALPPTTSTCEDCVRGSTGN